MGTFIVSSGLMAINTIFIIGLIYKAIRYKEDIMITTIFSTMLAVALFSYIMAIHAGEFPDVVGQIYFAHIHPVIYQGVSLVHLGSYLLFVSSSIAYSFTSRYTPQIEQTFKGINYKIRIYLSAIVVTITSLMLWGQML